MHILRGILGLVGFVFIAWLFSERKRLFPWRNVLVGIGLQVAIALLFLKFPGSHYVIQKLNGLINIVSNATVEGTQFVFGYLSGAGVPFQLADGATLAPIFFFQTLAMIIVYGSIFALLFHWRILQRVIGVVAVVLRKTLRIDGPTGTSVASTIFMGSTECLLIIQPYVPKLSRTGLFCIMTAGLTTITGTLMAVYAQMLDPLLPGLVIGHLLVASFISAPAAVLIAMVMIPETGDPLAQTQDIQIPSPYTSCLDAITKGATSGAQIAVSIAVLLVTFLALTHIANHLLGKLPDLAGAPLSLERIFSWIFAPVLWLAGMPWDEAIRAGDLMALKTVFNEFVAYVKLAQLPPDTFTEHSRLILIYALCGFANFASLGIVIGGISTIAPSRRGDVIALSLRSLLSATIATLMTGTVIGLIS